MKISIITPNYNYAQYIGHTIESIVNQGYKNVEHIIVDDGSTDNSVEVIKDYQNKYPNKIKLIQQNNSGQSSAINRANAEVTGDIVGWINSDDYYTENIFDKIIAEFTQNKEIEIVYGNYNIVDLNGNFLATKNHIKFNYFEAVFAGFANVLTSNAIFWKSSLTKETGIFREVFKCNMDGDYFYRLTYNRRMRQICVPIANHRQQAISLAGKNNKEWKNIVIRERQVEFEKSYNNLKLSNFVKFEAGRHLMYPVLLIRKIKKVFFHGCKNN
jgi:glycosyltransferase involved in cell wall biosynthesis